MSKWLLVVWALTNPKLNQKTKRYFVYVQYFFFILFRSNKYLNKKKTKQKYNQWNIFIKRHTEYAVDDKYGGVINTNRHRTDQIFIILLGVFILVLVSRFNLFFSFSLYLKIIKKSPSSTPFFFVLVLLSNFCTL